MSADTIGPVHERGMFNIDSFDGERWHGGRNRSTLGPAIQAAKAWARQEGCRYRVCDPEGRVVFDTDGVHESRQQTGANETMLNGASILSIPDATPAGLSIEVRTASRRCMHFSMGFGNTFVMSITSVEFHLVMVGRITGDLSCLFMDKVAIDVTPEAGEAINKWLAQQLKVVGE